MIIGRFSISLAVLVLFAGTLYAGSSRRVGTSGAQELRIPIGSRATAMGGSVIADVSGIEATFWNPAGLVSSGVNEVMFSQLSYFADMNLSYAAAALNFPEFGSIGISAKILDVGDITVTTEESPEGTGDLFSPSFAVIGLTFSRMMTDRVNFGLTGKFINEQITRETARGVAFDFGFQYSTGIAGLRFGMAIKNIGPDMTFTGSDLEEVVQVPGDNPQSQPRFLRYELASFELPTTFELGTAYEIFSSEASRLVVTGNFQNNNFSGDQWGAGTEYVLNDIIYLRGGYLSAGDQEDFLYGLSLGGGVQFNLRGNTFSFDYSWQSTEFFDDNQYYSLSFVF